MQVYTQPQPVASRKQTQFTAETARIFEQGERVSSHVRIAEALSARKASGQHPAECDCEAYHDVFTAARWRPQGCRPRKGTKAIRLPIFVTYETKDIDKNTGKPIKRTKRWLSFVFCRCQIITLEASSETPFAYAVDPSTLLAEKTAKPAEAESERAA